MVETRGTAVSYGTYGLKATSAAWINSRQIEAARKAITFFTKKGGKMWIRIFPDRPITKKPPEVTMGSGKGAVDHYVIHVRPGRVMFEVDGLDEATASLALMRAGHKLPVTARVVKRGAA